MVENEKNKKDEKVLEILLTELAAEEGITSVADPRWESAGWFEWERYVPHELRRLWPSFSMETRLAVALVAKERADAIDVD